MKKFQFLHLYINCSNRFVLNRAISLIQSVSEYFRTYGKIKRATGTSPSLGLSVIVGAGLLCAGMPVAAQYCGDIDFVTGGFFCVELLADERLDSNPETGGFVVRDMNSGEMDLGSFYEISIISPNAISGGTLWLPRTVPVGTDVLANNAIVGGTQYITGSILKIWAPNAIVGGVQNFNNGGKLHICAEHGLSLGGTEF